MKLEYNIHTPEGSFGAYIAKPAKLPAPAIVVIQEAFGVNANMRACCDEFAAQGYVAVCPDLYWRQEREVDLSEKDDAPKAFGLYGAMDIDAAVKDVQNTVAQLKASDLCSGRVGVMGYCLGALLTYLVAVRGGVEVGVCYHGGRTEEFLGEASALKGPILMHLAGLDEYIPQEAQDAIRATLRPKGVEIHDYPGCYHAFARHNGQHFNAEAAKLANGRTADFLKRHLAAADA
jgi:carboxymethylenebutenolidase